MLGLSALVFAMTHPVAAQPQPQTELKVVGGLSSRPAYKEVEEPFWSEILRLRSNGAVTAQIKGFDEVGLKGK
jgi:hypothetical protein